jgi:3-(3-hydroxy-phenyl)propionate hydroxylase
MPVEGRPAEERVFIAGAGPVGLTAAANLVRQGIPVTVFEAGPGLSEESRASTFHPPTLDMLDELGAARELIAQGLVAPQFQFRTKRDGIIAQFDFAAIADATRHPYRLQCEQFKLTRILYDRLRPNPSFAIEFGSRVEEVSQTGDAVAVAIARGGSVEQRRGLWMIGADGARSAVRRSLGIDFEGFTWPERFLVVSTSFDFHRVLAGLVSVNYVADPDRWHFLLEIPGVWRVMFPTPPEMSDDEALAPDFARVCLESVAPGVAGYDIAHTTLYRVHQRVAKTYRAGRVFLAGDAAHINNPLGGMGMNGGVHDAVNLTDRLAAVWHGDAPDVELDRYDRQRRLATIEHVQTQSIQNKRNLEATDEASRAEFKQRMRAIAADPKKTYDYLLGVSMIASLRRMAELG